jgi:hypothetical protein
MSYREKAAHVLNGAEDSLRRLLEQALLDKEYKEVAAIAPLADAVTDLLHSIQQSGTESSVASLGRALRGEPPDRTTRAQDHDGYPRFEREDDRLVKIGWSKKEAQAYEQRAPRDVVFLMGKLLSRDHITNPFSMDELMERMSKEADEVPSYQAYLALAWFRSIDVVERRGKNRYIVQNGYLTNSELRRLWDSLPTR